MSFITPLFLWLGLLAGPIILLYMLRLRRREVLVSSTMLWQKLLRDREANAPWQRLRRNLLLLLQLLILVGLVLALARPFIPVPAIVSGNVVVLLDGSASMQATDVAPSRFTVAQEEVNRLINNLSGSSQMTLIKVGRAPSVLAAATNDRGRLRQALENARPDPAAADWPAAFALAAGVAQGFRSARIVLVSDGGLPDDLPPLPAETAYVPVGTSGENLAISALATRDTESGPQLFASVSNEGIRDHEALLSLTLDGTLFDSRRITVAAGSRANFTWQLPPGTALIRGTLTDNQEDFLNLDDTAWAVHEGGVSHRTLLVTEGNLFLEQVYSVLPGIEAFKTQPGSSLVEAPEESFDLYVFDGTALPSPPPAADMLIINPPPGELAASSPDELFSVTGLFSNTVAVRLADTPLLQFVDWSNVHVRQAKVVSAAWAQPLVTAEGGPLIMVGERDGRRIALFTFDLRDSDLPLQIAFPILMANITDWLSPGRAFDTPNGLPPGAPVTISPGASTTAVSVLKPGGTTWTADVTETAIVFAETDELGLYQVSWRDNGGERPAGSFAVNLFSPEEAEIQPTTTVQIGQSTVTSTAEADIGQRELWPWLLAIAFFILFIEWWVHHRGTRLPIIKAR
jgi:Ca-activated chloride channel family protein